MALLHDLMGLFSLTSTIKFEIAPVQNELSYRPQIGCTLNNLEKSFEMRPICGLWLDWLRGFKVDAYFSGQKLNFSEMVTEKSSFFVEISDR